MAVYTKLNSEEINQLLKNYDIGNLISFQEIIDGIDNSNFIIKTSKGKFILTIFESRIKADDLPFFMNLKLHLAKKNICCPKPISNNSGSLISTVLNKPVSIVTFLNGMTLKPRKDGYYDNIKADHCLEVGKNLALLHDTVIDFKGYRENDLGILGWKKLLEKMSGKIDGYSKGLKSEIDKYIYFLEQNWDKNLSGGVLHLDLFPDNVFFDDNGTVTGIIDFYFSANDLFIYDLAIIINSWCFDENNQFQKDRFDAVFEGYKKIRVIPKVEMDFLKIALIGASLRFLLTRLYDYFFTPKDSVVNIKNPDEYLQKIRFFSKKII